MKTKYAILPLLLLYLAGCGSGSGVLKNESDMQKYLNRYKDGKTENIDRLILTYQDEDQEMQLRLNALKYIIESNDPIVVTLLEKRLERPLLLTPEELEVIIASVIKSGDSRWTPVLMRAYLTYQNLQSTYQNRILEALYVTTDKDQMKYFIDLYQRSQEGIINLNSGLGKTLGKFPDDQVVPVLISIINNPKNNIKLREEAMHILARKNSRELAGVLTKMIGTPDNELMLRDFAFNVLETGQDERLLLALLEFLQRNKDREYKMMQTVIDVLGDYSNPAVIPSLIHIFSVPSYPADLRARAVTALVAFNRADILDQMIDIMNSQKDYTYWPQISEGISKVESVELRQKLERTALENHLQIAGGEQ